MHRRDLPASLDLLRGFEAAARLLSFTAAAGELFLTQSAVSRQVQQLEEQLGVKLFERRTRSMILTDAGRLYYQEVAKALALLREATATIRAETTPIVRVTTTVTFASLWLVPRLAQFQAQHDGIAVHILADNTVRDLERAGIDVAIRYCPAQAAGDGAIALFEEQVAPVASPKLLRGHKVQTAEDLLKLPLLDIDDPNSTTIWLSWAVWCEAMKVTRPHANRGLTFSHYDQIMQAAIAGQGVALGRFPLIDPLVANRQLILPLKDKRFATAAHRAYWLIVSPTARRPEVSIFADWMQAQARALVALPRRRGRAKKSSS
ncbi:MAG TPA: LysR substrate-binding domain-containing protein [Burkholderiaceae bacterium]|nr:LysR substrate-binding domain-containing protein [Burkholderiaceae bacterium]